MQRMDGTTGGRWVDDGPRSNDSGYREGDAGPVNGRAPYTYGELHDILRQGKERPRPLTAEETALAGRNRRDAYTVRVLNDNWALRGFVSGSLDGRARYSDEPNPDSLTAAVMGEDGFDTPTNSGDYWLSVTPVDNEGWRLPPGDTWIAWSRDMDAVEALMHDDASAGGLVGVSEQYDAARRALSVEVE